MSREIKFRAWDKELGAMLPVNRWDFRFPAPHPVMQDTGLHDKNGTEIYEGDIVFDVRRVEGYQHIEVYWSEKLAAFMLRNPYKSWTEELHPISARLEVVGNIYETPELLNAKQ